MYGLYTPVFLLQAFCVYHAYRNNAEQRWYWLILLFPLIGSVVYLVHTFNNRDTLGAITENLKEAVISNYRIEQLEKAHRFSDNVKNKVSLADAYSEIGRYDEAVTLYRQCLQGFMSEDPGIKMKLLYVHFMSGNYKEAIAIGNDLEAERVFLNSEERVVYAWGLYRSGNIEAAGQVFSDMNRSFTNYFHRLEYCKFLLEVKRQDQAKENLAVLIEEFDQMQPSERNLKKNILRQVKDLYTDNFSE